MKVVGGITEIELSVAELTFSGADPWIDPIVKGLVAFTVVDPPDTAVAVPRTVKIDATEVSVTVQVSSVVRSCVVESLKSPIAV